MFPKSVGFLRCWKVYDRCENPLVFRHFFSYTIVDHLVILF